MKGDIREKMKLGFKDALRNPKDMFKTTGPEFHTADVPVYSNLGESEPPTAPVTVKDRLLDKLTKRQECARHHITSAESTLPQPKKRKRRLPFVHHSVDEPRKRLNLDLINTSGVMMSQAMKEKRELDFIRTSMNDDAS